MLLPIKYSEKLPAISQDIHLLELSHLDSRAFPFLSTLDLARNPAGPSPPDLPSQNNSANGYLGSPAAGWPAMLTNIAHILFLVGSIRQPR